MTNELVYQDELEVMLSLLPDSQLLQLSDIVEEMIKREVYRQSNFPMSCGGLRALQATILFSFWIRKGQGIRVVEGKVEVCPLDESPYYQRYKKDTPVVNDEPEISNEPIIDNNDEGEVKEEWV